MNEAFVFAAATALCLMGGATDAATPYASNVRSAGSTAPIGARPPTLTVLYDQQVDDSGLAIVSQMFESTYSIYDSVAADDFTVPQGSIWTIKEIDVTGQYFNGSGPATSENVAFYMVNRMGRPAKKILQTFAFVKGKRSLGSFAIKLKNAMPLAAGSYFVSVQANLAFSQGGEWGWESTTTGQNFGNPAVWENPANGFDVGCRKWKVEDVCIPDGQGPDHLFSLLGTAK
jgi:hypothetical protein